MRKRILTGLKPTGDLTLGNYIGAIKQIVRMQEEYDSYLFVADLHAHTVYQKPKELNDRIRKFLAMYIACGIDPEKNVIYLQSENMYIPAISFLLECTTSFGEASRMIQFKEKSKENKNFSVGLFTYPVLMAADILYCDCDLVPVGIDQKQHVELARNIAIKYNKMYGEIFKLPDVYVPENSAKIKDLRNPQKKMSKSEKNAQGVISLFDTPEEIKKKIMKASTDSENKIYYNPTTKPGISNLLNILSSVTNTSVEKLEKEFVGKTYKDLKEKVAEVVVALVMDIQEKYNEIINSDKLDIILDKGREKSIELAKEKYINMLESMGTVRYNIGE